jgi:hypothetical protein
MTPRLLSCCPCAVSLQTSEVRLKPHAARASNRDTRYGVAIERDIQMTLSQLTGFSVPSNNFA